MDKRRTSTSTPTTERVLHARICLVHIPSLGGGDGIRIRGPYVANVSDHVREPLVRAGFVTGIHVSKRACFATPSRRIHDVCHESTNCHGQVVATRVPNSWMMSRGQGVLLWVVQTTGFEPVAPRLRTHPQALAILGLDGILVLDSQGYRDQMHYALMVY